MTNEPGPASENSAPRTPTNKKLEQRGLWGVFGGGGLVLGSELLNENGFNGTATNTCFWTSVAIMTAGCVALILSERKPRTTKPYPLLDN